MSDKSLQLDANGDLHPDTFRQGAGLLEGQAATAQELKILLKTIRGEDPFDEQHGFRLFDVVTNTVSVLEREIRLTLNQDDRVESVVSVEVQGDDTDLSKNRTVGIVVVVAVEHSETVEIRSQI